MFSDILLKVLSHGDHGNSECFAVGNWSILKTKQPGVSRSRLMKFMLFNAVRTAQICTHKHMEKHRRASSSGPDSDVHLHLKEKNHSLEDNNVNILARKDRYFEKGVIESICVSPE